jgi:hypothetical protein
MRVASVRRVARWGAAVLLFLVLCHGAPRTAQAACNHLVTSNWSRSIDWNHVDRLIEGDSSSFEWDDRENDRLHTPRPPIRQPCSGPGCSNRVPFPSSTSSQAAGGFDQWGNLPATLRDQVVVPAEPSLSAARPHPQGERPSIFHPPPV